MKNSTEPCYCLEGSGKEVRFNMREESTILAAQMEVKNLVSDIDKRISAHYDKYTVNSKIPKLPPFEALKKDKIRYECIRVLTNCVDEINDLKLRTSLLQRSLIEYKRFQPSSKATYVVVSKFKDSINEYLENLDRYKFDLADLARNANNKIKTLESAQYYDFN